MSMKERTILSDEREFLLRGSNPEDADRGHFRGILVFNVGSLASGHLGALLHVWLSLSSSRRENETDGSLKGGASFLAAYNSEAESHVDHS